MNIPLLQARALRLRGHTRVQAQGPCPQPLPSMGSISVHQNLVRSIPPPQTSLSAALPPPPLLLPTPIASLTWRAAPANRYSPSGPRQTLLTSGGLPSPTPPGWIIVLALPREDSLPAGVLISDALPWRVGLLPAFP